MKEEMYVIKINDSLVASSSSIEKAMNAVQQEVANFLGVRNINFIEMGDGIIYKPWANIAECVCTYNNEVFKVYISSIKFL